MSSDEKFQLCQVLKSSTMSSDQVVNYVKCQGVNYVKWQVVNYVNLSRGQLCQVIKWSNLLSAQVIKWSTTSSGKWSTISVVQVPNYAK